MYIFQSEQVINFKITSLIFKSPDLNTLDYHVWGVYWDAKHAKTDQHCRAEDFPCYRYGMISQRSSLKAILSFRKDFDRVLLQLADTLNTEP